VALRKTLLSDSQRAGAKNRLNFLPKSFGTPFGMLVHLWTSGLLSLFSALWRPNSFHGSDSVLPTVVESER